MNEQATEEKNWEKIGQVTCVTQLCACVDMGQSMAMWETCASFQKHATAPRPGKTSAVHCKPSLWVHTHGN